MTESELAKETLLDEEIRYDEEVLVPSQKISTRRSSQFSPKTDRTVFDI